ncbi:MAG: FG-GAP-like repeat-containing protein [Aquaticitalea sp.]
MALKLPYSQLICGLLLCILCMANDAMGQTFERIETIAGLGHIQNNAGVAVADYDGDNDLDIFVVALAQDEPNNESSHSRLLRNNNNGTFTDVTTESGLINMLPYDANNQVFYGLKGFKHGVSWGDYDNDGYPDIFFTHSFKVQLFHNQGDGTFIDVTQDAGFPVSNQCRNIGSTWFDYNNDGFLDLFINDWDVCPSNSMYLNNGNGTFQNVATSMGIDTPEHHPSYAAVPFDINDDGWMDLYVSNDYDKPNHLFVNQSGSGFIEQSESYGLDNRMDDMGITIGDFNLDGHFDMFITGIDENALLQNDGSNHFTETSAFNNIPATGWAWGTRFADFDLDGDDDLIIVNGFEFQDRSTEPNVYYKNLAIEGQSGFSDASAAVNFNDLTVSVEAADFDYDNDGDLDIYVTNADQTSIFYENKLLNFDEVSDLNWFKVHLQGTISNRDAIGTTLTLTTNQGVVKRHYSGVGFLSQSLQAVHFGLGTTTQITQLEIKWPSGLVETYPNLDTNTTIKAIEGQSYTVMNIPPSNKVYGCTDSNSCSYNPEATLNDGSCTYLPTTNIVGPTNSGFFKTETYSYSLTANATANWTVSGGELLSGQGSSTVTVRWGLHPSGSMSVMEINDECQSLPVNLNVSLSINDVPTDKSIARLWNEVLLDAIRGDYARPTVHARNLFHASVAMYDAWAIYDEHATPYMMGKEVHGFRSDLVDFIPTESVEASRRKAISFAMYRLLTYRFQNSPSAVAIIEECDFLMDQLGYDTEFATGINYEYGNAAALGNYIAQTIIRYGGADGSREVDSYTNAYYEPVNPPMAPILPGNPDILNPNRWQPLSLDTFIDQSGNVIPGTTPSFLGPEWGNVTPFALQDEDAVTYSSEGHYYKVYHDPSSPPFIGSTNPEEDANYKWSFSLVSIWGSHLNPHDGVEWDISPKSIGNIDIDDFPSNFSQHPSFYKLIEGGDIGEGRAVNPITGTAYESQIVPRGDYARVLAEFWADGPDSETPPGHWFTILNYVNDNPLLVKKLNGVGEVLDPLEWDVKSYFILGGTMHDSAISAWGIKGWYDYIRPISAIRYMADQGQSTDASLSNYNVDGIPLREGYVEVVQIGDPLSGSSNEHVGKIKVFTWRGHDFIDNTATDEAGVGWILAENWWPYQRPTFVTPPFAGYVSGHSTYSRAAAEVMTRITGSEYFPGGMGEFIATKNEFLVFEEGPSMDVKLQWATYRDASDQCSLSRIWGGIHPPIDDIPGRIIGETIGREAFDFAVPYFNSTITTPASGEMLIYPNPIRSKELFVTHTNADDSFHMFDIQGRLIQFEQKIYNESTGVTQLKLPTSTAVGLYVFRVNATSKMLIVKD